MWLIVIVFSGFTFYLTCSTSGWFSQNPALARTRDVGIGVRHPPDQAEAELWKPGSENKKALKRLFFVKAER